MSAPSLCAVLRTDPQVVGPTGCPVPAPLSQQTPQDSHPLTEAWTAQAAQEGTFLLISFYPSPSLLHLLGCSLTPRALAW